MTNTDIRSDAIDAFAEAGMEPASERSDLGSWVAQRYEAVRVSGNRLVLAKVDADDEVVSLAVTTLNGVFHMSPITFPATELGLAMFTAAANAA